MKKTIQNAMVGALALFGLFAIITGASSNENSNKSVYIDNSNFEMYKMEDNKIMIFNKQNGEIEYNDVNGEFAFETIDVNMTYEDVFVDFKISNGYAYWIWSENNGYKFRKKSLSSSAWETK